MNFAERVKDINPSVTLAITSLAKEIEKKGRKIINFAAGEPDFLTPDFIKQEAYRAIRENYTKYTTVSGIKELKDAIICKFKDDNDLNYDPCQILVSTGAKQSLYNFFQAICQKGDEVIIPSPYWVSYPEMVRLCSSTPVIVPTQKDDSFKLNSSLLESFLSPKTKVIILNSPANPTGAVYSFSELEEIAQIAVDHNIYVLSDEIYEKIVYKKKHISIASLNPDIYELTIVVNGVSKSYAMTGWRIGYAAGSKEIISKMASIQSHSTSCPNSIAQYAAVAALKNRNYPCQIAVEFKQRCDYITKKLDEIKISYLKPEGAFYVFCEIDSNLDSQAFALKLLEKEGVAVVPGTAFGKKNYIRISFAAPLEDIEKGMEKLRKFYGENNCRKNSKQP